jgi:hypothetical protein
MFTCESKNCGVDILGNKCGDCTGADNVCSTIVFDDVESAQICTVDNNNNPNCTSDNIQSSSSGNCVYSPSGTFTTGNSTTDISNAPFTAFDGNTVAFNSGDREMVLTYGYESDPTKSRIFKRTGKGVLYADPNNPIWGAAIINT